MFPGISQAKPQDLVMICMDQLAERVNETRRICKDLLKQGLLSEDTYRTIVAAPSSQDRMKQLLQALSSKGQQGSNALYRLLQEFEPELTLQMEHAAYVHMVRKKLIHSVRQVEPVANRMLTQGLITESEYFQVCEKDGSKARMRCMFRVLDEHGMIQSDGFYNALFHCEPLLYRELEKERVLQMCELDEGKNQSVHLMHEGNLEERWMELKHKEKQVEKEKELLKREWDLLEKRQAEMNRERKEVLEMKRGLKKFWQNQDEEKDEMNSYFLTRREEQRTTEAWEHLNNNSYHINVDNFVPFD